METENSDEDKKQIEQIDETSKYKWIKELVLTNRFLIALIILAFITRFIFIERESAWLDTKDRELISYLKAKTLTLDMPD